MYELFYKQGACSLAVHVLLNELGVEYTLSPYDKNEPNSKILKVNPRGQVPTLVVDGEPITEGAAILSWLADTHESPMLPNSGMARAKALQWLAFANSSLHPLYGRFFGGGEAFAKSDLGVKAEQSLQELWDIVEAQLGKTKFLAGEQPTLGDILGTVIAHWTPRIAAKITLGPKTKAWMDTVSAMPSYKKAAETEKQLASKKSAA